LQREKKKLKGRRVVGGVVDVTCAVVASQVVAKNVVTQGQSEDERFATADGDFSRPSEGKKSFPFAADTKKDFLVCICFLLFSILSRARRQREKRKTNNGARENWERVEWKRRGFCVRGGKVSAKFPALRKMFFFHESARFFRGGTLMDGETRWPRLMEIDGSLEIFARFVNGVWVILGL
jgi:hypothetical protein